FAAPGQERTAQKRTETIRQRLEPAIQEQVAVSRRLLAGGDQPVAQSEILTELDSARLRVEKAIGADFDPEAVVLLGPDGAAGPAVLFEDSDVRLRQRLLQPIRQRQAGDARPDDDDLRHGASRRRLAGGLLAADLRFQD